jgi:MFS transporter, FHS family, L-fucose permease
MSQTTSVKTNYSALTTLTTVFFFWGFIAAGNSIFIPFCKNYFSLDQFQSQLIDFAFYSAYYLGALILFIIGSQRGKDVVGHWGYKKSIIYGLLFSALGAAVMIYSVKGNTFEGMLFGLFIVALGFSLQQTSANPFMISLGDESTGSNRINFGGAINSFGTAIGPLVVSLALFGSTKPITDDLIKTLELDSVITLYAFVGALFLGIAILFSFSKKLPKGFKDEKTESANKALATLLIITGLLFACFVPVFSSYNSADAKYLVELEHDLETVSLDEQGNQLEVLSTAQLETKKEIKTAIYKTKSTLDNYRIKWLTGGLIVIVVGLLFANRKGTKQKAGWGAMQYPQLTLGMLAIFVYVGVEVAVGSNLSELLKQESFGSLASSESAPFIAMYWGSLMIGRWTGAVNVFNITDKTKMLLRFIVPLLAFGILIGIFKLLNYQVENLYWYVICVIIQIIAFYIAKDRPVFTLAFFGILGALATIIGLSTTGTVAIYAFLSTGLFCSIMWPCIFSLSLAGLGKYQSQGSGFLVMMILGGAIIPPIQGKLSDVIGIQPSFIVGTICFIYLAFFAVYVNRLLKKQGIAFDRN